MKRNRWIVLALAAVNVLILCGCVFLWAQQDRTAPEFRFQTSDYTWLASDGETLLLQNIIAYDNVDGDITDRIVIEKIVENEDSSTVVVYYAVSDMAGNVSKVSRIFPMESSDQVPEYMTEEPEEEALELEAEAPAEEESGETDTEEADETEDESGEEEETDEEADEEETEEAEPVAAAPVVDKSGWPVLTLKKNEVTIEAGTNPPWTELIETLRDDKDDYTTLYYNLHISKFTSGRAGDYPVTLQAEDSDGNLSDVVTVTVHVK